jgi:hypothetical protein
VDAAVAAIIGAGIGASASVVGALVAARQQQASAVRRRKQTLYAAGIKRLVGTSSASEVNVSTYDERGYFEIPKDPARRAELIRELIDTQYRLAILLTACGRQQRRLLEDVNRGWDEFTRGVMFAFRDGYPDKLPFPSDVYDRVLGAARADLAGIPGIPITQRAPLRWLFRGPRHTGPHIDRDR